MTFHHLPQKNNKIEFTLVDDIKPEDVCDYAIMSGDGVEDLTIQGLFNFNAMKYNNNKVITIMLDTLSCFLGYGNITPITEYPLMRGIDFHLMLPIQFVYSCLVPPPCVNRPYPLIYQGLNIIVVFFKFRYF